MTRKKFKDLDLSNAFLFSAALSDKETCRMVLEIILGHPVGSVNVRAEHSILFSSDFRSVRLDIYASDEFQVGYNVELQNANEYNLPKRSRYHQAEIDAVSLKPGEDFNQLCPSYIIFICTFDPFGHGCYRYTFEHQCQERDFLLGDGTRRIFLNTEGQNKEEVPEPLIHFLKYVKESTDACVENVSDGAIDRLHKRIAELKESRELEARYMQLEEYIRKMEHQGYAEGRAEGRAEGHAQGCEEFKMLMKCLIKDGRQEWLPRLAQDEAFYAQMREKYIKN